MRILVIVNAILLFFLLGCGGKESVMQEDDFLKKVETSLVEQGIKAEKVEPPTNAVDIAGKVAHQYLISAEGVSEDSIFIFVFKSAKEASEGLKEAKTAVATQTKVDEYKKGNILVFYYALDGNLSKYDKQIK
ncbi:hypothetical protein, partial [Saccharibacillus sacchari]